MLKPRDPPEKLLDIGGLAPRPAGAAGLLAIEPTTLESRIKKLGFQCPCCASGPSDRSEILRDIGRFPPVPPTSFHGRIPFNHSITLG